MQVICSANRIETYIFIVIGVWLMNAALTNMFAYCF